MAVYNSSRVGQLNDIHLLKYLYVFFLCRLLPGVDIIFSRDNIILQSVFIMFLNCNTNLLCRH